MYQPSMSTALLAFYGITLVDVARRFDVTPPMIGYYLSGHSTMPRNIYDYLASIDGLRDQLDQLPIRIRAARQAAA